MCDYPPSHRHGIKAGEASIQSPPDYFSLNDSIELDLRSNVFYEKSASVPGIIDSSIKLSHRNELNYPGPVALSLMMIGICSVAFLMALDRTIVATAILRITNDLRSPNDVG